MQYSCDRMLPLQEVAQHMCFVSGVLASIEVDEAWRVLQEGTHSNSMDLGWQHDPGIGVHSSWAAGRSARRIQTSAKYYWLEASPAWHHHWWDA